MLKRSIPVLLTLPFLPASAFAIDNLARVTLSPNFSGGGGPIDDIHQGLGPQDASDTTTGGFSTTLAGTAHTDYSHVHLAGFGNGSGNAGMSGYIRDMVTITAPGIPTNTIGSLSYYVTITGTLHATFGSSGASYGLQTAVGGSLYNISISGSQKSPDLGGAFSGSPFATYHATTSFQFGQPFLLDLEYSGAAQPANSFTSTGQADLDISLFWGGISGISSNGTPVTNASLSSDSGTHWLNPSALLGDANLDGKVDLSDLSIVLNNFGKATPNWTDGNFDNQPAIDLTDLSDVLNNFGATGSYSTAAPAIATPEPATLSLTIAATSLLITRRRPVPLASRQ